MVGVRNSDAGSAHSNTTRTPATTRELIKVQNVRASADPQRRSSSDTPGTRAGNRSAPHRHVTNTAEFSHALIWHWLRAELAIMV